jgi:hypothetical protein
VIEKLLVGLLLAVCIALLLRLVIGERLRWRLDRAVQRVWSACRNGMLRGWRWPSSRRRAARAAEEAIRRARERAVDRDGNVIKPRSFRGPRRPH